MSDRFDISNFNIRVTVYSIDYWFDWLVFRKLSEYGYTGTAWCQIRFMKQRQSNTREESWHSSNFHSNFHWYLIFIIYWFVSIFIFQTTYTFTGYFWRSNFHMFILRSILTVTFYIKTCRRSCGSSNRKWSLPLMEIYQHHWNRWSVAGLARNIGRVHSRVPML